WRLALVEPIDRVLVSLRLRDRVVDVDRPGADLRGRFLERVGQRFAERLARLDRSLNGLQHNADDGRYGCGVGHQSTSVSRSDSIGSGTPSPTGAPGLLR